jgi:hypothetical protein
MKALLLILAALLLPASANAANVQVRIAADDYSLPVLSPDSYTVNVTSDAPADLTSVFFVLPGHGAPQLAGDEYGEPKLGRNDRETSFAVLNSHGATVDERMVTWSGPFHVSPSSPLTFRLDVLTGPTPMWFFSGASARGNANISGTAKGADILVTGNTDFSINTTVVQNGDRATYTTTLSNGSAHDFTVDRVKAGFTSGFEFLGSTFGHPTLGATTSLTINWNDDFVVPAHSQVTFSYNMKVPCGVGSRGSRTKAWLTQALPSGQILAATGPVARVKLVDC